MSNSQTPRQDQSRNTPAEQPPPVVRLADHRTAPDESVPKLRLIQIPGGRVLEFNCPEIVIGRHSSADVQLPSREVSRFHCRLFCIAESWQVEDMGSLNGIQVNGEAVKHSVLRHSDVLRIANYLLQVDLGIGEERGSQCQFFELPSLQSPPPSEKAA